jgi:hypothetical protein
VHEKERPPEGANFRKTGENSAVRLSPKGATTANKKLFRCKCVIELVDGRIVGERAG